ncbi:hypothetical protein GGF43_005426, partial [Coemansia sp. RSA 2618]
MYNDDDIICRGGYSDDGGGEGAAAASENNMLGRSGRNTSEAVVVGRQRGTAHTMSASAADSRRTRAAAAMSYSPGPQTVTARMVDPSSSSAQSADYSPRGSSFSGHSPPMQHSHHKTTQMQQPTLAALALADSRGQLDSGLGHYYQPGRIRTDQRHLQGFYSEPVSGAGSPVLSVASASSARIPAYAAAGTKAGGASALGVVFPTKTTPDQRGLGSSAGRDSSQRNTDLVAGAGVHRDAVGSSSSIAAAVQGNDACGGRLAVLNEAGTGANGNNRRH